VKREREAYIVSGCSILDTGYESRGTRDDISFFLAFDDMDGHNLIDRSGTGNFETYKRVATD